MVWKKPGRMRIGILFNETFTFAPSNVRASLTDKSELKSFGLFLPKNFLLHENESSSNGSFIEKNLSFRRCPSLTIFHRQQIHDHISSSFHSISRGDVLKCSELMSSWTIRRIMASKSFDNTAPYSVSNVQIFSIVIDTNRIRLGIWILIN